MPVAAWIRHEKRISTQISIFVLLREELEGVNLEEAGIAHAIG